MLQKLLAIILCVLCLAGCGGGGRSSEQKKAASQDLAKEILQTPQSQQETQTQQEHPTQIPNNVLQQDTLPDRKDIKGRGNADQGREEPQYVNLVGYVVVGAHQSSELAKDGAFLSTPWYIPTYIPDNQFWNETEEYIEHKTDVIVREQKLKHKGYGFYEGYLLVERRSDHEQFYINVNNFGSSLFSMGIV